MHMSIILQIKPLIFTQILCFSFSQDATIFTFSLSKLRTREGKPPSVQLCFNICIRYFTTLKLLTYSLLLLLASAEGPE